MHHAGESSPASNTAAGILIVECGTSTSSRGRGRERGKNSLNVIQIDDRTTTVTHWLFSPSAGSFAPSSRHTFPRRGCCFPTRRNRARRVYSAASGSALSAGAMHRRLAIGQALAVEPSPLVNGVDQRCVATGQGHCRRALGDLDGRGELLGFGQRGGERVEGARFLAAWKAGPLWWPARPPAIRRGPKDRHWSPESRPSATTFRHCRAEYRIAALRCSMALFDRPASLRAMPRRKCACAFCGSSFTARSNWELPARLGLRRPRPPPR